MRRQDVDWSIERLETELAFRKAKRSLEFSAPTPDERRRHLLSYVLHNVPGYLPGWIHVRICEVLEKFVFDVERQKSPRLILTMPPRGGKSEIVSRNLPGWYLGRNPRHEAVVASYGQELADEMSRGARIHREHNFDIFPSLLPRKGGRDGIQFWETSLGGSYNAVGAGGPLVGRGFHLGIIDDPVKNPEAAESEVEREKLWRWYRGAFYTRAAPGAGILVMATRWHVDDLIGRLLKAMANGTGEPWIVLNFPALAEVDEYHPVTNTLLRKKGEALHPARYDVDDYERIRQNVGERVWLSQYQCRPTSDKGGTFRRAWYQTFHDWDPLLPPEPFDEIAVTIDANFKKAASSAMACLSVWGRYGWNRFVRLAEYRQQLNYVELRKAAEYVGQLYNPAFFLIEEAANGHALLSDMEDMGWTVIGFKPGQYGSKEARAEVGAREHEAGNVELINADWTEPWIEEHCDFPLGKFKDRVDADAQLLIYWKERARGARGAEYAAELNVQLARLMGQNA